MPPSLWDTAKIHPSTVKRVAAAQFVPAVPDQPTSPAVQQHRPGPADQERRIAAISARLRLQGYRHIDVAWLSTGYVITARNRRGQPARIGGPA